MNITTNDITIKQLVSDAKTAKKISIERTEFDKEYDFFIIHTNEVLAEGDQYEVFIPFNGELGTGLLGYYRSSYTDKKSNSKK